MATHSTDPSDFSAPSAATRPSFAHAIRRRKPESGAQAILRDVARAAGVSTASASRALTRPELVSDAVRDRVRYAASTLGYLGNAAARALSTGRSGLVGLVAGELADPVCAEALKAAENSLSARGIGLLIRVASEGIPAEACARSLVARGVDGVLFVGVGAVPDDAAWCAGRRVPGVSADRLIALGATRVAEGTGWERGLELVRRYLQQMGHRRIGVISEATQGARPELPGPDKAAVLRHRAASLLDVDAVRTTVRTLLTGGVTALVCASDIAAAAGLRECAALELTVPQRVSIVGWGNTGLARCLRPALTSVRVPGGESGEAAAECLYAAITGSDYRCPERSLKLVIRESSGPAPD